MAMAAAAATVPLGVLLRREVTSERMERPDVLCGEASRSRKGEDVTLLLAEAAQRVAGDPSTSFSVFALSNAGGRIIIASDGVWDDLTFEMALECSRGYPSDIAANRIVNEAILPRGLRDDTTCIVVDILPPEKLAPSPPTKWQGKIALNNMFRVDLKNNMFRRKPSDASFKIDREYAEPDVVEEIFEDGSAMLSRRLSTGYALQHMFEPSSCAVCQLRLKAGQGISIHANPLKHEKMQGWQGPFLCQGCHGKKEAMEGKRHPTD